MWKLTLFSYFELRYLFVPVSLAVVVTAVNICTEKVKCTVFLENEKIDYFYNSF